MIRFGPVATRSLAQRLQHLKTTRALIIQGIKSPQLGRSQEKNKIMTDAAANHRCTRAQRILSPYKDPGAHSA